MRFNPPPNWPPTPPGWAPDPQWQPDPAWGPAPPGWQFWVDDAAPLGAPPYPPGYPAPYPPGGPQKSRAKLWLGLAALVAVVVLAAGALVIVAARSGGGQKPSAKSDLTTLSKDLLVDRSVFPDVADGEWRDYLNDGDDDEDETMPGDITVSPQECADLLGGPATATQRAAARLSSRGSQGMRSVGVNLVLGGGQRDVHDYLDKCHSFTISTSLPGLDKSMDMDGEVTPLDVSGIPSWAVGYRTTTSSSVPGIPFSTAMDASAISGYYRGVLVEASSEQIVSGKSDSTTAEPAQLDDLVRLFNAQVDKLEAAP
ncbi:hypothetical protein [Mycolicibacillus trivialis]|uniref:Uncharacterized protein n=1 Tax=Mycolicibacillus trivialis TaxID=1798 RepID=A0A1X2EFF7_9MYCO|nr:hypothetical protein [Mycolicibacillus trivialis]ORX00113.1 hypothetical protein AWC30_15715 [Mycolicibacillus trivialis]